MNRENPIRFETSAHRFILCALVLLIPGSVLQSAHAQQQEATARFRLAQSFEQEGEWERALPIYEQLYAADPQNFVYFDALRRTLTQLKKYDRALELVQTRLRVNPNDIVLLSTLGSLYFQSGSEERADSLWRAVIRTEPKNLNVYRLVAAQMIEHRLYDHAMRIYREARTATGNDRAFADELAWLYSSFLQFAAAAREYVRILQSNPAQLSYVQSRMASMTAREEGLREALQVVREEIQRAPQDPPLRLLAAWLLMEAKDYDAALDEYRMIDRLSKANGQELYNFGQRALQEKAYRTAAKAFREVIEKHPVRERLPHARLGFARAIEELSAVQDSSFVAPMLAAQPLDRIPAAGQVSETRPSFAGALALYEAIITEHPGSEFAAQALMRIGAIRRYRFFDLDGALAAFRKARETTKSQPLLHEVTMSLAEVYTMQNDLATARTEYERLLRITAGEVRDRAAFRLSELDYFEAKFDAALEKLQPLVANVATDLANDALLLQYFIQENKSTVPVALAEFAKADLLMRQHKHAEALARFRELIRAYPVALLVDDALLRIGEICLVLNRVPEALEALTTLANEMPTSIFRDRAQFRIGEVYETVVKDTARAIETYEQLLTKYPHSLHAEEARKRIRQLRGDIL